MDASKYDRTVPLNCPTCGALDFIGPDPHEEHQLFKCRSCGREITREDLIRENSENIEAHVQQLGGEVVDDLRDELCRNLEQAFRGSKYIKFK